jgi:hypothetical protein
MKQRLPLALSAAALLVAVFGATSMGHAAVQTLLKVKSVPFAKKAGFATRAGLANRAKLADRAKTADKAKTATTAGTASSATTAGTANTATTADNANSVNGIQASTTPTAGQLFPLGADAKFPSSVIPTSGTPSGVWTLTGNTGTNPSTNFLGTTDAQPLVFKTNNAEAMRVDESGNLGLGTIGPIAKLESNSTGISLLGTSTTRGIVGRLGGISCPGTYAVGGCAGDSGGIGVFGNSTTRSVVGTLSAANCPGTYAVGGCAGDTGSVGVAGNSATGRAVQGVSGTGIGVIGDASTRGVVGTLGGTSCAGAYAVGGCAGAAVADGVYGVGNANGAGVRAANTGGGNIFVGEAPIGTPKARIDATGKGFFDGGTQTGGADYAESIPVAGHQTLRPGDVLAVDTRHGFTVGKARSAGSPLVVGVYSTKPALLAVGSHGIGESLKGEVPVAMLGVVPTRVSAENGAIRPGDLLTTARTPGYAMKAKALVVRGVRLYGSGTILGKALQPLKHETGVVRVLLMLR